MICLQNLNKYHVVLPNVLYVMGHRLWDVSAVSRMVIEGPRVSLCSVDADPCIPCDKEIPLVTCSVPVDLAHGTRLDSYDCR